MPPENRRGLVRADVRNGAAREVKRISSRVGDDLHDARIGQVGCVVDTRRTVDGTSSGRSSNSFTTASIDDGSISGSSPCTLTTISQDSARDLGQPGPCPWRDRPTSSRRFRRRRPPRRDALVVGRHHHGVQVSGLLRGDRRADHRPAGDQCQRLAREPSGMKSCGNDADNSSGANRIGEPRRRNNGHGEY